METEALKGQIWQVPYLAAYWFWRGAGLFFGLFGELFFGLFQDYFSDFFGLCVTTFIYGGIEND